MSRILNLQRRAANEGTDGPGNFDNAESLSITSCEVGSCN